MARERTDTSPSTDSYSSRGPVVGRHQSSENIGKTDPATIAAPWAASVPNGGAAIGTVNSAAIGGVTGQTAPGRTREMARGELAIGCGVAAGLGSPCEAGVNGASSARPDYFREALGGASAPDVATLLGGNPSLGNIVRLLSDVVAAHGCTVTADRVIDALGAFWRRCLDEVGTAHCCEVLEQLVHVANAGVLGRSGCLAKGVKVRGSSGSPYCDWTQVSRALRLVRGAKSCDIKLSEALDAELRTDETTIAQVIAGLRRIGGPSAFLALQRKLALSGWPDFSDAVHVLSMLADSPGAVAAKLEDWQGLACSLAKAGSVSSLIAYTEMGMKNRGTGVARRHGVIPIDGLGGRPLTPSKPGASVDTGGVLVSPAGSNSAWKMDTGCRAGTSCGPRGGGDQRWQCSSDWATVSAPDDARQRVRSGGRFGDAWPNCKTGLRHGLSSPPPLLHPLSPSPLGSSASLGSLGVHSVSGWRLPNRCGATM